jgi:hypothetical protein
MYKLITAVVLTALGLASAHADDNSAQVLAAVPVWPLHATQPACEALARQASDMDVRGSQAGAADSQQVQQAGQASAADVQSRYGAQTEQSKQAGMGVAQQMQALMQKYQGNQQAMMADPQFQQLLHQSQNVNQQVVATSQQATATSQPLRDSINQGMQKQQQYCGMLDAQNDALKERIKAQVQAAHARIGAVLKAQIKGSCKMLTGEYGPFPEDSCVHAIGDRHHADFDGAANGLLQGTAPDYGKLRQGAQQCAAAMDGVFAHSAEKYTRATQLLRVQADACDAAQSLYDVYGYLN